MYILMMKIRIQFKDGGMLLKKEGGKLKNVGNEDLLTREVGWAMTTGIGIR